MNCRAVRSLFSCYLDGAAQPRQTRAVSAHLCACAECQVEYRRLAHTQKLVAGLAPAPVPADLELRLQVALSQARAQSYSWRWQGFQVRVQNFLSSFMLPATAGVMSAVLVFALLIGYIVAPSNVEASGADQTPMLLYSPPQLSSSPFVTTVGRMDGSLVVETYVDSNGRVQDYRILSAPAGTEKLIPELDNMLIFTTFRPAMNLGTPIPGRVVLSFSGVNVRG